ncbi:FUSC family protein [Methanofollis fontis]|uniref:Integral membrane bound transporter domain-containing protein n=1 Tax=Methanofollis fontis TaxID=2052832 RepID=A0A483CVF4_9EURY|nr:FUSC family protein [Methanofollis fontis]TAJ45626.1 hypothetical protein CUJ86_02580 [Methanofollis fontis]
MNLFSGGVRGAAGIALQYALVALLSYVIAGLVTALLEGGPQSAMIGGLWAMISGIVVMQERRADTESSALLRVLGSLIGAVFAAAYLLVLPFNPVGMALLIGITVLACQAIAVPAHGRLAAVTVGVVMVFSTLNPETGPVLNAALRFGEVVIGSCVAVLAVRLLPEG